MITADTITDEQIRELRESVAPMATPRPRSERTAEDLAVIDNCDWALSHGNGFVAGVEIDVLNQRRLNARARCAEILNARKVRP